jgi:hypothetical protein
MEDEFWEYMILILKNKRRCHKCGELLWVSYCDGHVSDQCLTCPYEFTLDLPGYIGRYECPETPMPSCMEVSDGGHDNYLSLPHERYYRLIEDTNIHWDKEGF